LFDAKTLSQKLPWPEVKGKPAAPLEGPAGIGRGINETTIGEYQSYLFGEERAKISMLSEDDL
jgi:hypothetical protein